MGLSSQALHRREQGGDRGRRDRECRALEDHEAAERPDQGAEPAGEDFDVGTESVDVGDAPVGLGELSSGNCRQCQCDAE